MSEKQNSLGVSVGSKRRRQGELHSCVGPVAKTRHRQAGSNQFDVGTSGVTNKDRNHDNKEDYDDVWNEEQHKRFVSSIFEIGLNTASPQIILENMTQKVETITSERVKSKLQKYRSDKNKEKSKEEFMANYCDFLRGIKSIPKGARHGAGNRRRHQEVGDSGLLDPILSEFLENYGNINSRKPFLLGGDVAGYLTYSVMKENKHAKNVEGQSFGNGTARNVAASPTNVLRAGAREFIDTYAGCAIGFPILSETEKKSSLGISITFIAGLFLTLSQHLTRERARAEMIGLKSSSPTTSNCDAGVPNDGALSKTR